MSMKSRGRRYWLFFVSSCTEARALSLACLALYFLLVSVIRTASPTWRGDRAVLHAFGTVVATHPPS